MAQDGEITSLLDAYRKGDRDAFDRLVPLVYSDLRRIARAKLRGAHPDQTLGATSLIHEAWVRLADRTGAVWQDRNHFLCVCARAMRQIVVSNARRKNAIKRGGEQRDVTFDEEQISGAGSDDEILDLDRALERLAEREERLARVVECLHFAGMTAAEAAEALGVSSRTVECEDDDELLGLVTRVLAHADADASLPGHAAGVDGIESLLPDQEEDPGEPGGTVGNFRIVREVGRGGMAVVYLAERADGEFRQQVALKLIKRGVDTDEVLRRFAQERQILAEASHPNIARLLDGGTTDDGRPYFVMEHIDGRTIDRYCDDNRLSIRERLTLFTQVAEAVAYAHGNLIIHRDIKPSNILVTADGVVKLLDFGIARYLEPHGEGASATVTRRRFLTPAWASPEQVRGAPVTTASDVYQLGLLLYRLLTGRSPYRTDSGEADALEQAICSETPTPPSTAVTHESTVEAISHERATSPSALRRLLAGDLDNIVLMALRKEPERRYASVAQFADDLRGYLTGLPVRARADTLGYRLSKFVLRHRIASGFAAVAVASLVVLAVTLAVHAGRIARERDRANLEAAAASEVSEFVTGLFKVSDQTRRKGRRSRRSSCSKGDGRISTSSSTNRSSTPGWRRSWVRSTRTSAYLMLPRSSSIRRSRPDGRFSGRTMPRH